MLLGLLYPSFCVVCSVRIKQGASFCAPCLARISPVPIATTQVNGKDFSLFAVSDFSPPLSLLAQAKGMYQHRNAAILGALLSQTLMSLHLRYDGIVPIPLHWSRWVMRGYNQAAIMAHECRAVGPIIQPLWRWKMTASQRTLSGRARTANITGAFACKWWWSESSVCAAIAGKRLLIVDDVYTSGATMRECARTLYRLGASRVDGAVACRVVLLKH